MSCQTLIQAWTVLMPCVSVTSLIGARYDPDFERSSGYFVDYHIFINSNLCIITAWLLVAEVSDAADAALVTELVFMKRQQHLEFKQFH